MTSLPSIDVAAASPDDVWHLSASSVVKALAAEALSNWAIRETAERLLLPDNLALVNQLASRGQQTAAVDFVKELRYTGREPGALSAADRGTEIHDYLDRRLLGMTPKVYSAQHLAQLSPFFQRVEDWLVRWQPEPVMVEQTVYNPEHGLAGRFDLLLLIPRWERMVTPKGQRLTGPLQLFDTKTAEHGFNRWGKPTRPYGDSHAIQLSIYANATHVATHAPRLLKQDRGPRFYLLNPQELAAAAPMPAVDGAIILHVTPEHAHAHPVDAGPDVYRFALNVREAWRWLNGYSASAVGDVLNIDNAQGATT